MRAACYCRKSTDNEAGVARQVELAREFIASKGWTLDEAHIYADNDVSGVVFSRPALNALLAAIRIKPRPFDVLVMMEASRLGREQAETLTLQVRITGAGVRIFHYQDGQELLVSTPTQKLVASVSNYGAEEYRYQIRLKTAAANRQLAKEGKVAGAKTYGYRHVDKKLVIDDTQAQVIRRIFEMAAQGTGSRDIAKALNASGTPSPRGGEWHNTTIRVMLSNERYIGRIVYGKRTRPQGSEDPKARITAPQDTWVVRQDETARIIPQDLWDTAQRALSRKREVWSGHRKDDGTLAGRPEAVTTSAHLLAGLLRCQCGGSMIVIPRANKDGSVRRYYVCIRSYKLGSVQCPARHYVPYDSITNAIVGHFTQLEEGALDEILSREWDAWWTEQTARQGAVQALEERREALDHELEQLGEAVAKGGELPTLLTAIRRKERERAEVAAKLEHAQGAGPLDTAGWHARLVQLSVIAMQGLRASLEARGREGRELLKIVLQEPVVVAEEYEAGRFAGWTYRGAAQLGELLGRVPASGVTHGQHSWRTW